MQIIFVGGWGFTETHYQPFLKGLEESLSATKAEKPIPHTQSEFPAKAGIQTSSKNRAVTKQKIIFVDFYNPPSPLPSPFIGIGHSLGVAYFLKHHANHLSTLINISGFPCFVKTPQQPYGASPKILRAMQQKFETHPEQVLQDFYQNCGVETIELLPTAENNRDANSFWLPAYAGDSDGVCTIKSNPLRRQGASSFLLKEDWYKNLRKGLEILSDTAFHPAPLCPTLSLHSKNDAIVSISNIKHFGRETIVYEGASHALPLTHTAQVIQDIVSYLCP